MIKKIDYRKFTFSGKIKKFYIALMNFDWRTNAPDAVFIRDYENLPESSPFDIDILAGRRAWNTIKSIVRETAAKNGLKAFFEKTEKNLLFSVFDFKAPENSERLWTYCEVHPQLDIRENFRLVAGDIPRRYIQKLPVPEDSWRFLLLLLQGVRKNKLDIYREELEKILDDENIRQEALALCRDKTGLDENAVRKIMNNGDINYWREKLKIKVPRKKTPPKPSFKRNFSKFVFKKLYFIHPHNPLFYSIHGADGVGKTTALNIVSEIFEALPLPFTSFHHISEWKTKNDSDTKTALKNKNAVSIPRGILKTIWRFVPEKIKYLWGLAGAELKYNRKLNNLLADYFFSGTIMLMDRYIYDNCLKTVVNSESTASERVIKYMNCRIARPPRLALMIRDEPEKVHERKQQLSVENIRDYQKLMVESFEKLHLNFKIIDVNSRKPEEIAKEIMEIITDDLSGEMTTLVGEY